MYCTVLCDSLAKDSASTSISSPVRNSSSITNSTFVSLIPAILFVIRFRGLTIFLPRITALISASKDRTPSPIAAAVLYFDILAR